MRMPVLMLIATSLCAATCAGASDAATRTPFGPQAAPRSLAATDAASGRARWSWAAETGFDGGPGAVASLECAEFARGIPFALRFGAGYAGRSPGDGILARAVFINNNTNGTLVQNGHRWSYRLDAVVTPERGLLQGMRWSAGPRLSRFTAHFDYVDGNEEFDVTSHQWGVGAMLEKSWPIGAGSRFALSAGADWFFGAALAGHGTTYSPDGTTVNPHEDFGWGDADEAIHQPKFEPRVLLGIVRGIGR